MLEGLNIQQKSAVIDTFKNNSLVLAGAGSGKTRVLITRIQYILEKLNKPASSIMAITFTNKAADELLSRAKKATEDAGDMWVGTYHSICIRLLKMFGEDIGLNDFTILDPKNAKKSAESVMVSMGIITSKSILNTYLNKVSRLKNNLMTPKKYREIYLKKHKGDKEKLQEDREFEFIEFYNKYQKDNYNHQTIDFDDIIMYTILLLQSSNNAKMFIKKNFNYIMADEVQDSNTCNFVLIQLLSACCNLFMVGDLDQSIYGFRGARPDFLVKYDKVFPNIKLYKLEQNYRSTKTIVNASNSVVSNNAKRLDKVCFSEAETGEKISCVALDTNRDEANFVAEEILEHVKKGKNFDDIYVLYRTNAQSRILEETFMKYNIPYNIIGSIGFNDRAEIKDCLSFLRVFVNKKDKYSFKRALSTLDGVGNKAIDDLLMLLDVKQNALEALKSYTPNRKKTKESIDFFINLLNLINDKPTAVLNKICDFYIDKYSKDLNPKNVDRIENIKELKKLGKEKEDKGVMLKDFVMQMDLLSKSDKETESSKVSLMTIHSSKGLESEIVFVVGNNEMVFPHENNINNPDNLEEERRLCYVAMTRAKKKLYMTSYYFDGHTGFDISRFIDEIPNKYVEKLGGI